MTIRRMECCVCGADAGRWKQHWNRDTGYGICTKCINWVSSRCTPTEIADLYGKEGVNWGEEPNPEGWQEVDGVQLPAITWADKR